MAPSSKPSENLESDRLRLVESRLPNNRDDGAPYEIEERRRHTDRRDAPTRSWDSLVGFYRRRKGRREGESENIYVDSYTRQDVALTIGVLVLNILDAFFTLRWLSMGGGEGNPLMEMLIRTDYMLFLLQKCIIVGLWLVVLVIHKNFRIARYGLWGALMLYAGVLIYHFVLQTSAPPPGPPPGWRRVSHIEVRPDDAEQFGELQFVSKPSRIPSSSERSSIR